MKTYSFVVLIMLTSLVPVNLSAEEEKMLSVSKSLMPDFALKVAKAALSNCRKSGYQISVTVVDSAGHIQVVLRDQLAGFLTPDASLRKARTAINFRNSTSTLKQALASNPLNAEIQHLPGVLMLGGGVAIAAGGYTFGAVGVSGAPGGDLDDQCAKAGIESIQEALDFL